MLDVQPFTPKDPVTVVARKSDGDDDEKMTPKKKVVYDKVTTRIRQGAKTLFDAANRLLKLCGSSKGARFPIHDAVDDPSALTDFCEDYYKVTRVLPIEVAFVAVST